MNDRLKLPLLLTATFFACLVACGPPDLEINGALQRTVGERLTAELLVGDNGFSGDANLLDAAGRKYSKADIGTNRIEDRLIEVKIPPGIAIGPAWLNLGQDGSSDKYVLPLQIGRLAATLNSDGKLEAIPLPGTSEEISTAEFKIGTTGKMSLSPDGGLLVVLGNDQIHSFWLGKEPKKAGAPYAVSGATTVAATNNGAVVGTQSEIIILAIDKDKTTEGTKFAATNVQHIAVDDAGTRAAALCTCENEAGDCLVVIDIASSKPSEIPIDAKPSAGVVGMKANGAAAVVVDEEAIYRVLLDGSDSPVRRVSNTDFWPEASKPKGISRARTLIEKTVENAEAVAVPSDLFAIHNEANNTIAMVAFDDTTNLSTVCLKYGKDEQTGADVCARIVVNMGQTKPSSLSFGQDRNLYVAEGSQVSKVNLQEGTVTPVFDLTANIVDLVVQP